MLQTNLTINCVTLFFLLFLMGIYFTKQNVKNVDNKIYVQLLIWNILTILTDIGFVLISFQSVVNFDLMAFVLRLYYSSQIVWYFFLIFYVLIITNENNEKVKDFCIKNKKKLTISFTVLLIVIVLLQMVLPFALGFDDNGLIITTVYSAAILGNVVPAILIFIGVFSAIFNRKSTNKKKLLPLKFIAVFGITIEVVALTYTNISTALATLFMTSVSYLMFHTIENPDMKLITELEFARDQAEKSNNAKSDFLASMSHELRTPLNAIVGLSQLIVTSNDLEEIHSDGQDILKSSNNLLELVDSILDINKIDSNNMEIIESNYNPKEVFYDLEKITKVRIGEKNIELNTRFSDRLPNTLYGDKEKVKTIVNNILTNAVKYTNEGYVEFNVDCTNKDDICNLRITVTDSGRGLKEEQMDKLFTKFYRLDEDKDTDIEGTGLGLALTKSLLDLMGGKITVNSEEGIGSTFTVTLSQKIVNNVVNNTVDAEIL